MGFFAPLAFWLALTVPAILLFYFLKLRRQDRLVSSTWLWEQVLNDLQANAPWQRLKVNLLLFLQILLALCLVFALARPYLPVAGGGGELVVVLLDTSASMRATDIQPDRFTAAKKEVAGLIERLGPRDRLALIAFAGEPRVLASPTNDRNALRRDLDRAEVTGGGAHLAPALSLAAALAAKAPRATVVVVSDGGVAEARRQPGAGGGLEGVNLPAQVRVRYLPVGQGGDNLALAGLALRRIEAAEGTALARVANYGRQPREVAVELQGDGRVLAVKTVTVAAGGEADLFFVGLPPNLRVAGARLGAAENGRATGRPLGDALAADDAAWAVAAMGGGGRALLVTPGNLFLERALALHQGLEVFRVSPDEYDKVPATPGYDLYVFDRFLPERWPTGNVLVFGPPEGAGLVKAGPLLAVERVEPAAPDEPLLRYVAWQEIHVAGSRRLHLPAGWRPLLRSPAGPLLAVGDDGQRRLAAFGFELQQSDLPLRTAFPVLMENLLGWLLPPPLDLPDQVAPGEAVALRPSPLAEKVWVTAPDGRRFPLAPPFPPASITADQPGLYIAVQVVGGREVARPFAVNAAGEESDLAPRASLPLPPGTQAAQGAAGLTNLELWPWLGWLALALALTEWWVYSRAR